MRTSTRHRPTLTLSGWHLPFIAEADSPWVLKFIVFTGKVTFFILFIMMIRWTLPRFRFDQLMSLAWKVLIPLAIANLVCVMIVKQLDASPLWLLPLTLAPNARQTDTVSSSEIVCRRFERSIRFTGIVARQLRYQCS